MTSQTFLCTIEDIQPTGAFGTAVQINGEDVPLLLVIDQGLSNPENPLVRAYKNICPHIQTPLETFPNEFLDSENPNFLVCSTHGARFQVSDGQCVAGPCMGDALSAIDITVQNNKVFLNGGA